MQGKKIKHCDNSKAFIEQHGWYSWKYWRIQCKWKTQNIDCFNDMIPDMLTNRKS